MCAKSVCRSRAVAPVAALAAKYCAVTEQTNPAAPSATNTSDQRRIYAVSARTTPVSMIFAMMSGTSNSRSASNSLNSGPSTLCSQYSFR